MDYICPICKKEFKSLLALSVHYSHNHGTNEEFKIYWLYERFGQKLPKCKYCDNTIYIKPYTIKKSYTCNNPICKKKYHRDLQLKLYQEHPEYREVHRLKRLEYLTNKTNYNKTAWGIKANNEFSFLEKWFIDNIIIKYKLNERFDIINEYCEFPYFLDFAFLNGKIDVELDGRCHFKNGIKRIEHDNKRDNFLKEKGWKIYRISYKDVEDNESETIINFINSIKSDNIIEKSYSFDEVVSYSVLKDKIKDNTKKTKDNVKNTNKAAIKSILIDLQNNSNIDFSKFGWVNKAHNYLIKYHREIYKNNNANTLHRYIKLYYPEFYDIVKPFIRI